MVGAPPDRRNTNPRPRPSSTRNQDSTPRSRKTGGTAENRYRGPIQGGGTAFPWRDRLLPPPDPRRPDARPGGPPAVGTAEPSATAPRRPQSPPPGQGTAPPPPLPPGMPVSKERRIAATPGAERRARPSPPRFSGILCKPQQAHQQAGNPATPRDGGVPGLPAWPANRPLEHQDAPRGPPHAAPAHKHTDTNQSSMKTALSIAKATLTKPALLPGHRRQRDGRAAPHHRTLRPPDQTGPHHALEGGSTQAPPPQRPFPQTHPPGH